MTDSYIPLIDFQKLSLDRNDDVISADDLQNVGSQIKDAFQSAGFCYLKNYGASSDIIGRYFEISRDFFSLPIEEKIKYNKKPTGVFGWVGVESERLNPDRPAGLKEVFQSYNPVIEPHDWPTEEFKEASQAMFSYCTRLSHKICDAISTGLGLDETFLRDAHKLIGKKGNPTALRTLYYPPIPDGSSVKPGQIRLAEHSDYGTITILFQDNQCGLEVDIPGVGYVPAPQIPGSVIVNIGDLMQRWTSDELIATKHRVFIPEKPTARETYRQSIVFFVNPDNNYIVKCLDGSNKYEPISSIDYLNYRFSTIY